MNLILLAIAVQAAAPELPPAPPAADAAGREARFRECAQLARTDADRAVDFANGWRLQGGGIEARQCLGLAYVAQERWAPAATVYEQAAQDAIAARDARAGDFWAQAGNAWLAAGEPTRAIQALDSALAAPGSSDELKGEVHIDRARALVALGNAAGARDDLDQALRLVPADPFGWYLSAALARRSGDLARAGTDIARAMELAPDDPNVVLLAGTVAGLNGNMAEAERLYRRVVELAPESEAGRAAAASLATVREIEVPPTPAPPPPSSAPQSR
ncbi:hypothetical protein [Sphingosinicella terrae]|uniref:hypothetical protein n=1 Tax=Sphingosinicella terrae TaxID=2172047 RepID=UPI002549B5C3|nr:hypothetical protein [Sphingosinicella terrae]